MLSRALRILHYGNEGRFNENMATVSKLDYLKKYLSPEDGGKDKKVKKKKQKIKKAKNIVIIDSDVKFNDARDKGDSDYNDEFELEEEKPQIYFDGNTLLSEHSKKKDMDKVDKWAPIPAGNAKILLNPIERRSERDGSLQKHGSLSVEKSSPQTYIRKRHDSPDASKEYSGLASLSSPDLSPDRPEKGSSENIARKRQRLDSFDFSPKRKDDKESSPDLSPTRNTHNYSEKASRRQHHRHDSIDSKESVGNSSSSDLSPERVSKIGSISTQQGKLHDPMDLSPKRKYSTTDLSPPRRKSHVSPELLPNRFDSMQKRNRHSPDLSPERQKGEHRTRIEKNAKKHQRVSPEVLTSGKLALSKHMLLSLTIFYSS